MYSTLSTFSLMERPSNKNLRHPAFKLQLLLIRLGHDQLALSQPCWCYQVAQEALFAFTNWIAPRSLSWDPCLNGFLFRERSCSVCAALPGLPTLSADLVYWKCGDWRHKNIGRKWPWMPVLRSDGSSLWSTTIMTAHLYYPAYGSTALIE